MDFAKLARAATATDANALKYAEPLGRGMDKYGISTVKQRAMCVSQIAIESMNLSAVQEGMYYKDAQYLANTYRRVFNGDAAKAAPYTRNPKGLATLLYGPYYGRGLIQLTWEENYRAYSKHTGIDYMSNPDWLLRPEDAAMSACWFFAVKTDCRTPADQGDVTAVTLLINGKGLKHLAERKAQFITAMSVPGL